MYFLSGFSSPHRNAVKVGRFVRDDSGSVTLFTLFLFILMALFGGIALDIMKYETTRTTLQQSLDRCTLMAAAMNQKLVPEEVVRDCIKKAGLEDQLQSVKVTQGLNFRNVEVVGKVDSKPFFMHMIGIDKFDAAGASKAEQNITNVEIVMVLDVSGSMSGAKLANLKTAASEFVDTMMTKDVNKRISIAVVPYNAQVNLGSALREKYNATNLHGVTDVNCLEVPPAANVTTAMPRNLAIPMMAYADIAYGTNTANAPLSPMDASARPRFDRASCPASTANIVRLPSQNVATLQGQINALQAAGNTSIMLGMKWGVALLDPSAQPMFSELAAEGAMAANLANRPFAHEDEESIKVVILMTDGEHVQHDRINDAFKTGPSPVYLSAGDGQYSMFHAGRAGPNKYWVPHLSQWRAAPWNSGAGVAQQNWETVWANLKLTYVAWQFYGRALGTDGASRSAAYNAAMNTMRSGFASAGTMNAQLQQTCQLAKESDVLVFGIAFEAPANGRNQIAQCASSAGHYFDATGLEIRSAFRAIASNLSQLKLTQ